jgi:hypothetical protein
MQMWNYKGYSIVQKNQRNKESVWISSAKFRTRNGELNLTALPSKSKVTLTRPEQKQQPKSLYATTLTE